MRMGRAPLVYSSRSAMPRRLLRQVFFEHETEVFPCLGLPTSLAISMRRLASAISLIKSSSRAIAGPIFQNGDYRHIFRRGADDPRQGHSLLVRDCLQSVGRSVTIGTHFRSGAKEPPYPPGLERRSWWNDFSRARSAAETQRRVALAICVMHLRLTSARRSAPSPGPQQLPDGHQFLNRAGAGQAVALHSAPCVGIPCTHRGRGARRASRDPAAAWQGLPP